MRWGEVVEATGDFGKAIQERFARQQIVLIGTIRPDGSPRISGVECDFCDGDLMLGMIWQSAKARDLLRDDRLTIHSVVPDKARESENEGDVKIYGRAIEVTQPDRRRRYERVIHARLNWTPPEPYHLFAVDVHSVGMVRFVDGARQVTSWRVDGELRTRTLPAE